MRKILYIFCIVFFGIILSGCAANNSKNTKEILIQTGSKIIKVNAEIADDNDTMIHGLMFRKSMGENAGMLFVFEREDYETFWMKNTLIPLDIIFIGRDMEIGSIISAVPCKKYPCELYRSQKPVKYVLEVNGGFADKNNISAGSKIILR